MNHKNKKWKVLELFAGAGGLALGLEKAGFESVGLVELDLHAVSTLKKNRPKWNVIHQDVQIFSKELNPEQWGEVDIVSGGFPCQPFSYAGMQKGLEDTRGTLFHDFAQVVDKIKPKIILAENVKGLLRHDGGKTFTIIKETFESLGYQMHQQVLNAWDYGVAQKRERIILVGIRRDLAQDFSFPKPLSYKPLLKDILKDVPLSEGYEYPESKRKVLDLVPQGGCHRDLPEDVARDYMKASYFLGGGKTGMARRLSWGEPSLTLTTSPMQKQTERCHPDETRPFRVREYARIQDFPDDWEFIGSKGSQYKQIGNAVPVGLAYHLGLALRAYLEKGDNK